MKFNTKVIHGNQQVDPSTGAVNVPIYQSSTYKQKSPGIHDGYEYSRAKNPTRTALEGALASIEHGCCGLAFSSGLGATDAVLKTLKPGDEVIACDDLYGGTYRMFTKIYAKYGIKFQFVNLSHATQLEQYINSNTRLVWIETPSNPLLKVIDIQAVHQLIKDKDILLVVDNTFATPYLQKPLELGADIAMHSATKYLAGHSDVVAGALIFKDEALADQIYFEQYAGGAILGPQDSYLTLRGIKTLAVRMDRHCSNGQQIADYLVQHPGVEEVYYPGLSDHFNHEVAKKQMKNGFGGMVSFTLKDAGRAETIQVLEKLHIFTLAESLGGVESLANYPAEMTHASIPAERRKEFGITDNLIRLSVGIEDVSDLIQDLADAL